MYGCVYVFVLLYALLLLLLLLLLLVVCVQSRQDWHRNIEAAIQHHSTTLGKYPAISIVEPNGKCSIAVTYGEYYNI